MSRRFPLSAAVRPVPAGRLARDHVYRIEAFRAMLIAIEGRAAGLIKEGKTLEQALAAKPSSDFDAAWNARCPPTSS